MIPTPIYWNLDKNHLQLIDQTRLPVNLSHLVCLTHTDVGVAIKRLSVRGAPAIGIAAAYGVVLAAFQVQNAAHEIGLESIRKAIVDLSQTRPTAVNLFWALDIMKQVLDQNATKTLAEITQHLLEKALSIHNDDKERCQKIGEHGLTLLAEGDIILTHCNAGALATGGIGTALAPIYLAHNRGMKLKVFADETRPLLQGSRLTAWELRQAGIDVTVISDNTAAAAIRQMGVTSIIVGADRITKNGDVANKIGTYGLALMAQAHQIPLYVAAPLSTFDISLATGEQIPIEEHPPEVLTEQFGTRTAPLQVKTFVPAFDVTPNDLVTAIITEKGIIRPPYQSAIELLLS